MKKSVKLSLLMSVVMLFPLLILLHFVYAHGKITHALRGGAGDITYTEHIKPVFKKRCARCHGEKSPEHMEFIQDTKKYRKKMKGPKMHSYTHMISFVVWPDTGSLMRALDDGKNSQNGKPGKMYRHLGKSDEERQQNLDLFKRWVSYWTLKEWDDIDKEEINKMKLIY